MNLEKYKQKVITFLESEKVSTLKNTIITVFFAFLTKGKENIVSLHSFIKTTWHTKKIYSWFILLFLYVLNIASINSWIYKTYNWVIFDLNIRVTEAHVEWMKEDAENEKLELNSILDNSLLVQIEKTLQSKKDLCIESWILDLKKDIRSHSFILPSDETINYYRAELSKNECSVNNLGVDVYKIILEKIFWKDSPLLTTYLNNTDWIINKEVERIKAKIVEEEIKQFEEVKETQPIEPQSLLNSWVQTKSNTDIKAIFCIYWHGTGPNWPIDNWAQTKNQRIAENNGITEWDLNHRFLVDACNKIRKEVEPKWIKVFEIWKDRMKLTEKRDLVNDIAKKYNLNETNSIWISLHMNSVSDSNRSWVEVYYSQLETAEKGFQGQDLANNVLYQIKKNWHNFWNKYNTSSDKYTRYKSLGILSETKPLIVLVEYWFLSNIKDVEYLLDKNNKEKIVNSLSDWILTYLK